MTVDFFVCRYNPAPQEKFRRSSIFSAGGGTRKVDIHKINILTGQVSFPKSPKIEVLTNFPNILDFIIKDCSF